MTAPSWWRDPATEAERIPRGPWDPARATPRLGPGWARRTTSLDHRWPEGLEGPLVIEGVGRDLCVASASDRASIGRSFVLETGGNRDRRVLRIVSSPDADLEWLVGAETGSGYRMKLMGTAPPEVVADSLLWSLLEGVSAAAMLASVAHARQDRERWAAQMSSDQVRRRLRQRIGQCAGQGVGSAFESWVVMQGRSPLPGGPVAPPLELVDDDGWHELPKAQPLSVRRVRRVDVELAPATGEVATGRVDAMFRDSVFDEESTPTVLHEYALAGEIDHRRGVLSRLEAIPKVLPYAECPAAADSAKEVVGHPIDDLRRWVALNLMGESTCTHLNEALKALCDIAPLLGSGRLA